MILSELLSIIPDDGYTDSAYIAAQPGLHGAHRITFRPMTHQERYVIGDALGKKTPGQASQLMAAAIAKHVKQWDVCAANGGTLPINAASAAMLKPDLTERMYAIVSGRYGGDQDPDKAPESDAIDAELQAVMEGRTVGEVKEEADLKN